MRKENDLVSRFTSHSDDETNLQYTTHTRLDSIVLHVGRWDDVLYPEDTERRKRELHICIFTSHTTNTKRMISNWINRVEIRFRRRNDIIIVRFQILPFRQMVSIDLSDH